jgi:Zn finger protein HypA/HybF involved in hydrogenase expression
VPARLRCDACAAEWEIELPVFRCPTCGGADVVVRSGEELEVESIEVAEEAQCIA